MNLSKVIPISKSSLVGLKTELLKKQEEVNKIKESQKDYNKTFLTRQKKIGINKSNTEEKKEGLCVESESDDCNIFKKSREVLEAKARLYDKLRETSVDRNIKSQYLINFDLKHDIYKGQDTSTKTNDDSEQQITEKESHVFVMDNNSDSENDWVEFVDTLGRSRSCLRSDLEHMKAEDKKLAESLQPPSPPSSPYVTPELMSWDMQREVMRKKWEEQENLLLEKKEIHYQSVRFDEARSHGVGYFEFSIDENERLKQQQELKNLRNETIEQQEAAVGLRVRRQQQLQARLAAARRRKRKRLGLPCSEELEPQVPENDVCNSEEQHGTEEIEDIEESIKRITSVRPWDVGKQGTNNTVLSQEEWNEKKRQERPNEFAPPSSLLETIDTISVRSKINPNCLDSKKTIKQRSIRGLNQTNEKCNINNSKENGSENMYYDPMFENTKNSKNKIDNYIHERKLESVAPLRTEWKPTPQDIDDLLLKSHEKLCDNSEIDNSGQSSSVSLKNKNEQICYDQIANEKKMLSYQDSMTKVKSNNLRCSSKKYDTQLATYQAAREVNKITKENLGETDYNLMTEENCYSIMNTEKLINTEKEDKCHINNSSYIEPCPVRHKINEQNRGMRRWAEIPPPASISYYNTDPVNNKQTKTSSTNLADSISVGLNYLKTRKRKREEKKVKGLLYII